MLVGLTWGKGKMGLVWFSICGASLDDWSNGVVSLLMVSMVFVLWGVGLIQGNEYGILLTKLCYIATGMWNITRFRDLITGT